MFILNIVINFNIIFNYTISQLLKEEYLLQQPLYELYVQSSLNLIDNQQYSDLQLAINVENVSRCWDNLEKRLNDRDQILNKTYKSW